MNKGTSLCDICAARDYCSMEKPEMPDCFVTDEKYPKCPRPYWAGTQFCALSDDGQQHGIPYCPDCPY